MVEDILPSSPFILNIFQGCLTPFNISAIAIHVDDSVGELLQVAPFNGLSGVPGSVPIKFVHSKSKVAVSAIKLGSVHCGVCVFRNPL